MGGVGAEAGPGREEEPAFGAAREEVVERVAARLAAVELLGDVEEEEGAPLRRRQAQPRGRPLPVSRYCSRAACAQASPGPAPGSPEPSAATAASCDAVGVE